MDKKSVKIVIIGAIITIITISVYHLLSLWYSSKITVVLDT